MRLINADALIEFLDMGHLRNPLESCFSERDVVYLLESRPTVDAVPVVRCRECVCWQENPWSDSREMVCKCWADWLPTEADDFCSYGERKEGADHA